MRTIDGILRCFGMVVLLAGMLGGTLAGVGSWQPAEAQLSVPDTRCRRALHSGSQRYYRTILAKQASCHRGRMLGKLSPLRDCTDPDRLPSSQILDLIESHLVKRAENACSGRPGALALDECMAPCDGIPIVRFGDVGRCLACLAKDEARNTTANIYGNPPVVGQNNSAVSCQTAVGAEMIRYATSLLTSHRRCQFLQDRGQVPLSIDCRRADIFGIFSRAQEIVERKISRRCNFGDSSELTGCDADNGNQIGCIIKQGSESTDKLFAQIYAIDDELQGKLVFVTADTYRPDEIGGLEGADAICQAAAEAADPPLRGTFKAWLSDGDEQPAGRFTRPSVPYFRPDGPKVADSYDDLVLNHPRVSIDADENGEHVIFRSPVWTGTTALGVGIDGATCDGWTSAEGRGVVGLSYFIGGGLWTDSTDVSCGFRARLYCFEQ